MPIKIPNRLPATTTLLEENIFVMTETRAITQDIRPLRVLMLNLMPQKIVTETQIARLIGNTPLQVELELLQTATHKSTHTSGDHMLAFYKTFAEVKDKRYDGMIITGAPVEQMPFEEVDYWEELVEVMDWTKDNVTSTLHICWGAQAGVYHHFGIQKEILPSKLFGVFEHKVSNRKIPLVRGFDDYFMAPHSRHTTVSAEQIHDCNHLRVLAESEEAGIFLCMTEGGRQIFVMGHPEYDRYTLHNEYMRDLNKGLEIELPVNYYPDNDHTKKPRLQWRSHSNNLYTNWLNYYVYQATPYDLYQK